MSETAEEYRQRVEKVAEKFYENLEKRVGPYRDQAFAYEKLAIEFAQKGFQTLTYLNGGALVALPAALAFFKADVPKGSIIAVASAFVIGLVLVVGAQMMAFFTMAKRAEASQFLIVEQHHLVSALGRPITSDEYKNSIGLATAERAQANLRSASSNNFRLAGLIIFIMSAATFAIGCVVGALAVIFAKATP